LVDDYQNPVREAMDAGQPVEDEGWSYDVPPEFIGTGDAAPADDWDEGGNPGEINTDWDLVRRCAELDQNDRDNGRRLLHWRGRDLCYVSGMGWLVWKGTHWERDESDLGARLLAQNIVDKIKLEPFYIRLDSAQQAKVDKAKPYRDKPPEERSASEKEAIDRADALLKALYNKRTKRKNFAVSSGNAGKTKAMLDQAASLAAIDQDLLDADQTLFNVENGTLCFSRREDEESDPEDPRYIADITFRPHDREDRITKVAAVDYDPKATCQKFEAFLERVQPDPKMRLFLQVFMAYSILIGGNDEQKLIFHYGGGANGKSVFIEAFGRFAGTYRTVVSPDTITGDGQRQGQQASPDIARLFNTRYVTVEELPKHAPLREELIKAVSGGTKMTARFLMQNIFEFEPIFTATLSGNSKPSIQGSDNGIWRRVLLVPWNVTIPEEERDRGLLHKLDAERSGILNWLIEGIKLYLEQGLAPFIPDEVTAFTEDYRSERDNVGVFAESCINKAEGGEVTGGALYKAYTDWCEVNGLRAATQRSFGDRLSELGYQKRKGRIYTYLGIKLGDVPSRFDPQPSAIPPEHLPL